MGGLMGQRTGRWAVGRADVVKLVAKVATVDARSMIVVASVEAGALKGTDGGTRVTFDDDSNGNDRTTFASGSVVEFTGVTVSGLSGNIGSTLATKNQPAPPPGTPNCFIRKWAP